MPALAAYGAGTASQLIAGVLQTRDLMALAPDQRWRVEKALGAEDRHEALAAVASMDSPAELHALMLEYNWDDGFAVPTSVLGHPRCERATALLMYHNAQGPWSQSSPATGEHGAFLARVTEQLLRGGLPETTVFYDPGLGEVQLYTLRKAGVPEDLLRSCGPR